MSLSTKINTKLRKNTSLHINDARIAGLYDLEHTIGKGHFAVVKLARHVFTGEKVAVKVIDKTRLDPISQTHMMQEVRCMKLVQHPNIVRLYEVIDTQTKLFLILELGDYDMYEWVMRRGFDKTGCGETDAQLYFSQIIQAIDYCHKLHVVHRDLKPENVVFFERLGMVKLTDFGFSNLFTPGQQLETSCGSLAYSAPEILLGDAYDAPAVDIWSLGVILYMLVCGRLPFQESNDSETLTRILDCKFSFPDHVSAECRKLISLMLVRDPSRRATLSEIAQNKWVRAGDRGHAEALPLILRDHLPACAHATIIEQMVAGEIGSEENILCAIERNEYNHLTATYYLLAERVLSCYRQAQANRLMVMAAAAARDAAIVDEDNSPCELTQFAGSGTTAGSSCGVISSTNRSRSRSNSWRGSVPRRAYSILKEESEEELSSYNLRSSSRQSSRFFNIPPAVAVSAKSRDGSSRASLLAISRANSNDSFAPGPSAIMEDDVEVDESCSTTGQNQLEEITATDVPMNVKTTASAGDFPLPSATSTPFLQRILAPICEFRDQSPDISVDSTRQNAFQFDEASIRRSRPGSATFVTQRPVSSRASQSGFAGQLPPLPSSPEKVRANRGPFGSARPLRNATSLELFPSTSANGKENGGAMVGVMEQCSATSPPTPNPNVPAHLPYALERHPNFTNLSNLPYVNLFKRPSSSSLSRRNSSPSVSAAGFRASNSLHSSHDRISPQAIQELLELSRLSGRMRRAASPDSRISSRSPSPSCLSSGRTSPAVSGIVSRLKSNSFLSSTGGMRKLSSSPHLLGICEEIEEGDLPDLGQNNFSTNVNTNGTRRDDVSWNCGNGGTVTVRSARSASMGLGTIGRISMPKKFSIQSRQLN